MVGSTSEEAVDVRIISATHKNLAEMMDQGLFRQDLYYRLNVIQLKMPSLRERPCDIALMAKLLLSKLCINQQIDAPDISDEALKYISSLPFPGNVRELENMLERALALCDGQSITMDDLLIENKPATRNAGVKFNLDQPDELNLTDYLENVEKNAIIQALNKTNNNKTAAAKLLGVTFRTLRYRLAKLGLAKEEDTDLENDSEPQ